MTLSLYLYFYTNKNLFHGEIAKYFKDGTVTGHIFGGPTDITFQKTIRDSKKNLFSTKLNNNTENKYVKIKVVKTNKIWLSTYSNKNKIIRK